MLQYNRLADEALEYLCGELERAGEHLDAVDPRLQDVAKHFDVQLAMGVLKLTLGPQAGTVVVNKQPPNQQLWLSSPVSYYNDSSVIL
jgi:frataxin